MPIGPNPPSLPSEKNKLEEKTTQYKKTKHECPSCLQLLPLNADFYYFIKAHKRYDFYCKSCRQRKNREYQQKKQQQKAPAYFQQFDNDAVLDIQYISSIMSLLWCSDTKRSAYFKFWHEYQLSRYEPPLEPWEFDFLSNINLYDRIQNIRQSRQWRRSRQFKRFKRCFKCKNVWQTYFGASTLQIIDVLRHCLFYRKQYVSKTDNTVTVTPIYDDALWIQTIPFMFDHSSQTLDGWSASCQICIEQPVINPETIPEEKFSNLTIGPDETNEWDRPVAHFGDFQLISFEDYYKSRWDWVKNRKRPGHFKPIIPDYEDITHEYFRVEAGTKKIEIELTEMPLEE